MANCLPPCLGSKEVNMKSNGSIVERTTMPQWRFSELLWRYFCMSHSSFYSLNNHLGTYHFSFWAGMNMIFLPTAQVTPSAWIPPMVVLIFRVVRLVSKISHKVRFLVMAWKVETAVSKISHKVRFLVMAWQLRPRSQKYLTKSDFQ